jgi:hemolysin activation/secretion protein
MHQIVRALKHSCGWLAVLASPALTTSVANAQAAAPPPPSPPSRDQIDPVTPTERTIAPASVDRRAVTAGNCPLSDSTARVSLTDVRFTASGGTPLAPELAELLGGLKPGEGGDQPVAVVCTIRDRANAALSRAGYLASIQIPAQEIASGTLNLVVVTARITEIRVQGELGRFRKVLEPRLAAIRALENPTERGIERLLLLADDIPGVSLRLTLKPAGTAPGDVIGDLIVSTESMMALVNFQNAGSLQLGREVLSARAEYYGLTGLADRTSITYSNTVQFKEAHILQVGHDFGLGTRGLRIGVRASYALSNPDLRDPTTGAASGVDLRSRSLIAGIDVSMPIVRSVNTNLTVTGGFEMLNQQSQFLFGGTKTPFTRDRTRVGFARLDGELLGRRQDGSERWHLGATVELRQGFDLFNATKRSGFEGGYQPSRAEGDPKATVARGSIDASVFLIPQFSLNGSLYGQWTNKPLLNLEEFSVGSLTYGRGYDPGATSADRVYAYRIEPRVHLALGTGGGVRPDGTPRRSVFSDLRLEFMGFYEAARIFNLDTGSTENDRLLRSMGGGFRLLKPGRMSLDVTYAKPLDRALSLDKTRPSPRVLVSFTLQLLPWRNRR